MELDPFTMLPAPPRNLPGLKRMFEFPDRAEQLGIHPLVEGTALAMLNVAGNCITEDGLKRIVDGMPR